MEVILYYKKINAIGETTYSATYQGLNQSVSWCHCQGLEVLSGRISELLNYHPQSKLMNGPGTNRGGIDGFGRFELKALSTDEETKLMSLRKK